MFATNINLSNSVTVKPLPTITNLPLGAPISPNVHAAPSSTELHRVASLGFRRLRVGAYIPLP